MNFDNLRFFMDSLTSRMIPGNTVIVQKDGKEVFRYSSGYSDLENKIPMQGNEMLNIYSCSKPVTVVAAMQLFEKGYFLLSDSLYDFIPEFKELTVTDNDGNITKCETPVTMWNLFTMTAGFSYDTQRPWLKEAGIKTNGKYNTLETIKCMAKEPLSFEPSTKWQYSLCHDVLAAFVEVVSGKKFRDYVKENIFDPLGMKNSFYHNEAFRDKMAQQYRFVDGIEGDIVEKQSSCKVCTGGTLENAGPGNHLVFGAEYDSGGAGIVTTVEDYSKFANALSCGGIGHTGEKIISSHTIDLIRTNQLTDNQLKPYTWSNLAGYGYGLGVRTMKDRIKSGSNGSIGEFGWGGAAGATLLVDPELKLGVAYAHHMLNPQEVYYQPRLRNVIYSCI